MLPTMEEQPMEQPQKDTSDLRSISHDCTASDTSSSSRSSNSPRGPSRRERSEQNRHESLLLSPSFKRIIVLVFVVAIALLVTAMLMLYLTRDNQNAVEIQPGGTSTASNDGDDVYGHPTLPEKPMIPDDDDKPVPDLILTKDPTATSVQTPTQTPTTSAPTKLATSLPTVQPTLAAMYRPGNLTTIKEGLLLSEGLDARIIARQDENVVFWNGTTSELKFHGRPDGGDTFEDTRPHNEGGWVYVSNSEIKEPANKGGVGAFTFDKDGNLIDYQMVLEDSTWNCGGGRTPWNTWVSCEEVEFDGQIYQVDPFGERKAEVMTLGSDGGRWESFAYDVRNKEEPHFFATEDHNKGTVRRFTPKEPDWDNDPWMMLHGEGTVDYLMISPNVTNNGGTFIWTDDEEAAKNNARSFYPQTEGIDVHSNEMFFVCKNMRQIFVLDLDHGTYWNATTVNGMFDGKPDQMTRILDDANEILYFTEEQGVGNGVHARDSSGRYYSILEGIDYNDETSGLSFSPDGMHMYFAFQDSNVLFDVFRVDGLPFNGRKLDVKYHAQHDAR